MTYIKNLFEGQASDFIAALKLSHENYIISLKLDFHLPKKIVLFASIKAL